MSARDEVLAHLTAPMFKTEAGAAGLLDAYRAEVLREEAESLRREAREADIPGSPATPEMIRGMKWSADWIDPDIS